jgi:hypothetical protein
MSHAKSTTAHYRSMLYFRLKVKACLVYMHYLMDWHMSLPQSDNCALRKTHVHTFTVRSRVKMCVSALPLGVLIDGFSNHLTNIFTWSEDVSHTKQNKVKVVLGVKTMSCDRHPFRNGTFQILYICVYGLTWRKVKTFVKMYVYTIPVVKEYAIIRMMPFQSITGIN